MTGYGYHNNKSNVPKLLLKGHQWNLKVSQFSLSVQAYEYATKIPPCQPLEKEGNMYNPVIGTMNPASFFQDGRSRNSLKINPGHPVFVDDKTWRLWSLITITIPLIFRWSRS